MFQVLTWVSGDHFDLPAFLSFVSSDAVRAQFAKLSKRQALKTLLHTVQKCGMR
jgi:hypothetical protein